MNAFSFAEVDRMDVAYRVILEPEPDQSAYNVIVPAFPKAHTWGGTVAQALANAREVIALEIEDSRESAATIPPSDVETPGAETITATLPTASPRSPTAFRACGATPR